MRISDWSSDVCSSDLAHLSRYAEELQPGDRVKQGEVIGYVGTTGLATGPNLHYEVLAKETPLNPVKLDLPPRRVLTGEELARFQSTTAEQIATLPTGVERSEEHTTELQSLMRISYAVFCLKKKTNKNIQDEQ